eukprot:TRINITY_DN25861_c0_g1_i1.p1 TRINITY_DN25861_c0_g1~~TRINITY_DN25861_c0_g1_i1.p1  ORF type:complete len:610 (-),score=54.03 TRINITY_DN25861_c0_g1_i1:38-1867(-)
MTETWPYEILGVPQDVLVSELRAAFKKRALEVHPDKGGQKERFQSVLAAFEILSDSSRRKAYDSRLRLKRGHRAQNPSSSSASAKSHGYVRYGASSTGTKKADGVRDSSLQAGSSVTSRLKRKHTVTDCNSNSSKENRSHRFLQKLHALLKILEPGDRRNVIKNHLTREQKLELEHWITSLKSQSVDTVVRQSNDDTDSDESDSESYSSGEGCTSLPICDILENTVADEDEKDEADEVDDLNHGGCSLGCVVTTSPELLCPESTTVGSGSAEPSRDEKVCGKRVRSMHGISVVRSTSVVRYGAYSDVTCVRMRSPYYRDLARALDAHLAFTSVKERVRGCNVDVFENSFKAAVSELLPEHGLDPSKDVHILITIPAHQFIGTKLPALYFGPNRIDEAMEAWRKLVHARGTTGRGGTPFWVYGSDDFALRWTRLRTTYMDVIAMSGRNVSAVAAKLDAMEVKRLPMVERCIERWNRSRMAFEERSQRAVDLSLLKAQRRERACMAREDRLAQQNFRGTCGSRGRLGKGKTVMERVMKLLHTWKRRREVAAEREARRRAILVRQRSRLETAKHRKRRDERWKWMNRRDLTMADLLSGPPKHVAAGSMSQSA